HDRDFMNRVVHRIIDIDDGELISYTGDYDFLERQQRERAARQEAAFQRQQAMLAKMQRFIDRFGTHVAKAAQAQGRQTKVDKVERIEPPTHGEIVPFQFQKPPRVGEDVAILKGIHKGYGARAVYRGFDFEVRRGERWCVMGQNGAGKSTLLKLI